MTKPRKPRSGCKAPVSLGGVCREELPLPYVHYPGHYGTFFAYSETEEGERFLCECAGPAVRNYIALKALTSREHEVARSSGSARPEDKVPGPRAAEPRLSDEPAMLARCQYKRAICHRCNLLPPSWRYCHEMYGVEFIQHFGWYVNQGYLKFGILPRATIYLPDLTPEEYVADIKDIRMARDRLAEAMRWFTDRDELARRRILGSGADPAAAQPDYEEISRRQVTLRQATTAARRAERKLSTKIENMVREEFGFRKVGDRWTCETLLFHILCHIFPGEEILRHNRPQWLGGLEIDIFLPSRRLAIEYQGQQHFISIPAWGGELALKDLQDRDKTKAAKCRANGLKLVAIDFTEPLTVEHVRDRLAAQIAQP